MKKQFALMLMVVLMLGCLSSCAPKGDEVEYIQYKTIDYNGGYTVDRIMNFSSGEVLEKRGIPTWDMEDEYTVIYTFDTALNDEILKGFHSAGIFRLRSRYNTLSTIMDGGGWVLKIKYTDGTEKESHGSNAGPYWRFNMADDAFFRATGKKFFRK